MSAQRIIFSREFNGELETRFELDGVIRALQRSKDRGSPVAVVGPHPVEEMQCYFREIRNYPLSNFVAIGRRGQSLHDLLYSKYSGRQKVLKRIIAFISTYVLYSDDQMNDRLINGSLKWPDADLADYLTKQYVTSRKKPEGSEIEIVQFFQMIKTISLEPPLVIRRYYYGWSAEQVILASIALSEQAPVVLVTNHELTAGAVEHTLETRPITTGDVFSAMEAKFHVSQEVIMRNYRLWLASSYRRNGSRNVDLSDVFKLSSLTEFAEFLIEAISEVDSDQELAPQIPVRIVAPLMFKESNGHIGIDHIAATGVSHDNAIGGVRALRNLTEDLRDSGVLNNAIVAVVPCLNRIVTLLDRIARSQTLEESHVVEFGVEFSYLESRVLNAQARLSKETMEFVLSYTGEGYNFLERFEAWQTYKAEGGGVSDGLGLANRDVAAAAIRLLRSASEEGLLDGDAAGRVADVIQAADMEAPLKRASLAISTQNLGAAVGRSALSKGKDFAGDIAKGAEAEAKKKLSESAAIFIHRHTLDLAKIATTDSGRWLAALLKTFGSES